MKPLLGILNRSRRKEMLHCKKNKKVLKWTVFTSVLKKKSTTLTWSQILTSLLGGRSSTWWVGELLLKKIVWSWKRKKKNKNIILNFALQCPTSSPSSIWFNCYKLHTNLALISIRFLKRCPKSKDKQELIEYLLELSVAQLSSYSTLREKHQFTNLIQGIPYKWLNNVTPSNYVSCDTPARLNSTILWARNPLTLSNSNYY